MSARIVYVSRTDAGTVAAWLESPPVVEPFRPADVVLEVGREHADSITRAALRLILQADTLSIGVLSKKWAGANKRVRAGRPPWEGAFPPSSKAYVGEIYAGRRLNQAAIEMLNPDELRRARELEDASDRKIAEALAAARAAGAVPFAAKALRDIAGIEKSIQRVLWVAFERKHPPRSERDLFDQLRGHATIDDSPFVTLGIAPTSDAAVVRAAWRRRALDLHPDRGGNAADFMRAKAAYDAAIANCEAR